MKRVLIPVFVFLLAMVFLVYAVFAAHVPRKTETFFSEQGLLFQEDGTSASCQIGLGGTLAEYMVGSKPPYFYTNEYASKQGLFLNGEKVANKMLLGWYNQEAQYVTSEKNSIRFFVDRELETVIMILPDIGHGRQLAIAPAITEADAWALVADLLQDATVKFYCPEEWQFLEHMLASFGE